MTKEVAEEAKEGGAKAWAHGYKSVLDVPIDPALRTQPITPPVSRYLDEVLIGMVGGACDPTANSRKPSLHRPGTRVSAQDRLFTMAKVLALTPSQEVCRWLFWLVVGTIFDKIPEASMSQFRASLGECWFRLMLQCREMIAGDRELVDDIITTMPFVLAQAIFRLLVDGFTEDRLHFVNQSDKLMTKTTQIAHFELLGFQITIATLRHTRRKLFLKRVLDSPHLDLHELMRGRRRQEMLEGQGSMAGQRPLHFGDAHDPPMDESQLEHVMRDSEMRRIKQANALSRGKQPWDLDTFPVPEEMSVARHQDLHKKSASMFKKHIHQFRMALGDDISVADSSDQEEDSEEGEALLASESMFSEPRSSIAASGHRTWSVTALTPNAGARRGQRGSEAGAAADGGQSQTRNMWRRTFNATRTSFFKEDSRARREREAKARKAREEILLNKITVEPLSKVHSATSLSTARVSPPIATLAGEAACDLLHKTSADDLRVTMACPKAVHTKPLSIPPLRPASRADVPRAPSAPPSAQSAPKLPAQPEAAAAAGAHSGAAGAHSAPTQRVSSASAPTLPRVTFAMGVVKVQAANRFQTAIGADARGNTNFVRKRTTEGPLEVNESFALYRKHHDVLTGARRWTTEPKKLNDEEVAYVKKLDGLVGGAPKRLIAPESMLSRAA